MKKVNLITDGSSIKNRFGGWCAIVQFESETKELSGSKAFATNNQMELKAVLEGLKEINEPSEICLYSDSKYVIEAIENGHIAKWMKNNWKNKKNVPVKNHKLWQELYVYLSRHKISTHWIKSHSGNQMNEKADSIALKEALSIKK